MKKMLPFIVVAGLVTFLAGCSLLGEEKEDKLEAPDVKSANELPSTGGIAPASSEDALSLFNSAFLAFTVAMENESAMASMKNLRNARASYTDGGDINWTGAYGGGTVNVTGSYSSRITYPDAYESDTLVPGTWYPFSVDYGINIQGTINGVEVEDDYDYLITYTISGEVKENLDSSMNLELMFDSYGELSNVRGELNADLEYGVAFSVLRNTDGVGAKFVISFAASASQNLGEEGTSVAAGTLKVYNDANEQIYSIDLTLNDLDGLGIDDFSDF